MNRIIKFRAFSTKDKCMLDWSTIKQTAFNYGEVHLMHSVLTSNEEIYHLMQFTGLTDKNGKEIYEGDIVFIEYNRIGNIIVSFKDGKYNITSYNLNYSEIIGNKHEHSYLLKQINT